MNDILFSQNSKQQHGKNFDITKYNRTNKFSLPYYSGLLRSFLFAFLFFLLSFAFSFFDNDSVAFDLELKITLSSIIIRLDESSVCVLPEIYVLQTFCNMKFICLLLSFFLSFLLFQLF